MTVKTTYTLTLADTGAVREFVTVELRGLTRAEADAYKPTGWVVCTEAGVTFNERRRDDMIESLFVPLWRIESLHAIEEPCTAVAVKLGWSEDDKP